MWACWKTGMMEDCKIFTSPCTVDSEVAPRLMPATASVVEAHCSAVSEWLQVGMMEMAEHLFEDQTVLHACTLRGLFLKKWDELRLKSSQSLDENFS